MQPGVAGSIPHLNFQLVFARTLHAVAAHHAHADNGQHITRYDTCTSLNACEEVCQMYMGLAGYPAKTCAHPIFAELMASGYLIWDQPQCKACPPMHDVAPTCNGCQTSLIRHIWGGQPFWGGGEGADFWVGKHLDSSFGMALTS